MAAAATDSRGHAHIFMNNQTTLYVFSGLPASGKTTMAERLASFTGAAFLRIDTIEQGLRDLCSIKVQGEGYGISYRVAQDNLKLGCNVIADSCNPIALTRKEWQKVAESSNADVVNIEVICSDTEIHKKRIKTRTSTVPNLQLPSWREIQSREYHEWNQSCIVIDTANRVVDDCFQELIEKLNLMNS